MDLIGKISFGLGRVADVYKTLLWQQAKLQGISPIQIQILLYIDGHAVDKCNVSHLAKNFQVTKPTISDAIRVLLNKELLIKDHSPTDSRRYNLLLTTKGLALIKEISQYDQSVLKILKESSTEELSSLYASLTHLIDQMNRQGIIEIQQNCYSCRFYKGNRSDQHYCNLMQKKLKQTELRLDCPEHEAA